MSEVVLDASAVLAFLQREPGYEVVDAASPLALISAVNLAEVAGKLAEQGMPPPEIEATISDLGVRPVHFDASLALLAGSLITLTRSFGLSLGDRACLALGITLKLPVLTTDRAWADLSLPIEVRVIR